MADTNKTLVFSAAVRGFHVYRDVWKPLENEEPKDTTYSTCSQLKRVV